MGQHTAETNGNQTELNTNIKRTKQKHKLMKHTKLEKLWLTQPLLHTV